MIHTYNVSGMTCDGCKASVEKSLNTMPNVENATVDLESNEVTISMKTHINLDELQEALPNKYKISAILVFEKMFWTNYDFLILRRETNSRTIFS